MAAMKPYIRNETRTNRRVDIDGTVTLFPGQLAYARQLKDIVTTVGDYRTPNPHAYRKISQQTLTGFEKEILADGKTREIIGCNLRNTNWALYLPVGFSSNVQAMALLDLYGQLRDSDIDLSVDGVQWRQTLAMLALWKRTCYGIARHGRFVIPTALRTQTALDVLNRGRLPDATRRRLVTDVDRGLNWLADRRLEYVYGIKPTMSTVQDLAKLATSPEKNQGFITIRAHAFLKSERYLKEDLNGLPIIHEIVLMERCAIVCSFAPANDTLEKLSSISSLNAASLIYEATPYSFVLDWAIGIGDWFRTMETALLHQNNFRGGYQSRSYKWIDRARWTGKTKSSLPNYQVDASATYTDTRFERTVLSSAPFPMRPVVKTGFGLNQALNAAALIKQKINLVDLLLAKRK